jgi:hypothetical protein
MAAKHAKVKRCNEKAHLVPYTRCGHGDEEETFRLSRQESNIGQQEESSVSEREYLTTEHYWKRGDCSPLVDCYQIPIRKRNFALILVWTKDMNFAT